MIFEEEKYYHVFNRSINKELLFNSQENYYFILKQYTKYLNEFVDTLAYCLMPTHFHLFIRVNKLYREKKEIDDDSYFSQIIAYIHLNPVKAKLCKSPEGWLFSSYNAIISDRPTLVKREEILNWFGNVQLFTEFHQDFIDEEHIEKFLF